jgi:hypothetical protein
MSHIPYTNVDWNNIPVKEYNGEKGNASSKTIQYPGLRIRLVEYSDGYLADHWCEKGHIVHCLQGELISEHQNGEVFVLQEGMSYVVSDGLSSHRSRTNKKVKLLIIDGDFLI